MQVFLILALYSKDWDDLVCNYSSDWCFGAGAEGIEHSTERLSRSKVGADIAMQRSDYIIYMVVQKTL